MTFLQFKKKFIELYNQQKFERFPKDTVEAILAALEVEEVKAPTLVESICLSAQERKNLDLEAVAALSSCLYEVLYMDEFKFASDFDAKLNPLRGQNLEDISINANYVIPDYQLNSSAVLDDFEIQDLNFKSNFTNEHLRVNPTTELDPKNIGSTLNTYANLTFFTNWTDLETISISTAVNSNAPALQSSIYYSLGEIEESAKLYESAAMRSMTEYYISHYTDNDDYISDVEDLTLHEFIYHEL